MNNGKYLKIYVDFLKRFIDIKKPLRLVFDCSNGTAGIVLKKLVPLIHNSKFLILNSKPDGNFPAHGPNPLVRNALKQLGKSVRQYKADLGVAFDADADRVFFIDNVGRALPSYVIAYLLFKNLPPPFVSEIFTYKTLKYAGLLEERKVYPSAVGTYFVREMMRKKNANAAAEYSGHYFYREFFGCDSGILTALKVMNLVSKLPYSLADFYDFLPKFYTRLFNMPGRDKGRLMRKTKSFYKNKALKIEKIDGLGFDFKDWFFVVRPSNTEPLLRFFVGAKDRNVLIRQVKDIKKIL